MAPRKKTAKKTLGKKDLQKTKGGIIAVRNVKQTPGISDGTSNTLLLPAVQNLGDGSV